MMVRPPDDFAVRERTAELAVHELLGRLIGPVQPFHRSKPPRRLTR